MCWLLWLYGEAAVWLSALGLLRNWQILYNYPICEETNTTLSGNRSSLQPGDEITQGKVYGTTSHMSETFKKTSDTVTSQLNGEQKD